MSLKHTSRIPVHFNIILDPSLQHLKEEENFTISIQQYVASLINDLGLPVQALVDVIASDKELDCGLYYIIIDEQVLKPIFRTSRNFMEEDISRWVQLTIYDNRNLLLTPRITKRVLEEWSASGNYSFDGFTECELQTFLLEFISRCFNIDRAKEISKQVTKETAASWDQALQEMLPGFSTMSIIVYTNKAYYELIRQSQEGIGIEGYLDLLQQEIFDSLGIMVPRPNFSINETMQANEICIKLNDVMLPRILGIKKNDIFVNAVSRWLSYLNLTGKEIAHPNTWQQCFIIRDEDNEAKNLCRKYNLIMLDPLGFFIFSVRVQIRNNANAFLTPRTLNRYVSLLELHFPDLVRSVLMRHNIAQLTQMLSGLLDDQIPIKDLRTLLEALLAITSTVNISDEKVILLPSTGHLCPVNGSRSDIIIEDYISHLRLVMRDFILSKNTNSSNVLLAYIIGSDIESKFRKIGSGSLAENDYEHLANNIRKRMRNMQYQDIKTVILTAPDVRKKVADVLRGEFPYIPVLSYYELTPVTDIQKIATIT